MSEKLTFESLQATADILKFTRHPVGIVVRPQFERAVKERFTTIEPGGTVFGLSLPVYTDLEQEEDCLVFYDRDLLRAYLMRNEATTDGRESKWQHKA